jgi:hypothetical protein
MDDELAHVYEVEDRDSLDKILSQHYHAVVGNPPYITVSDKALNKAYRNRFDTCHRKYSLGVPFTERFFELTIASEGTKPAGFMGMITTNSFMKREFGIKLINDYLPKKDLTHVIDTSGAKIPGHGTPTVILFARNQLPSSSPVRAVLSIKGEPEEPTDYSQGEVWLSICDLVEKPGIENGYVSSVDVNRRIFSKHPWSLEGGGKADAMLKLEEAAAFRLGKISDAIGFGSILGEDDAFGVPKERVNCTQLPQPNRELIEGGCIRSWNIAGKTKVLFPYNELIEPTFFSEITTYLWPLRAYLYNRSAFSGLNFKQSGKEFYEFHQIPKDRNKANFLIAFPFVATHNHFALDRGGKVFNRTAPIIKLPENTCEADHLALLGLLNSSVACFWARQVFFSKRGEDVGKWGEFMEFDGTKLKRFPIPGPLNKSSQRDRLLAGYEKPEQLARKIDSLAQELNTLMPAEAISKIRRIEDLEQIDHNKTRAINLRAQMVAYQEELDWLCYQSYGLTEHSVAYENELPAVHAGERAFEIQLARDIAESGDGASAWFTRHKLTPMTELPENWPEDYKILVKKRLEFMESNEFIKLIEQPEYKRRWLPFNWAEQEQNALSVWLLTFLERESFDEKNPTLITAAQLSDRIQRNPLAIEIANRIAGTDLFDSQQLVVKLLESEHVPQVAANRLKPEAMSKFRAWQETWQKQRQEDAIDLEFGVSAPLSDAEQENPEKLDDFHQRQQKAAAKKARAVGEIPVPPKYAKSDLKIGHYWTLRGKLDVPKERFFSFPGCEKPGDSTLVVGWAGMDHLQRARATAAWYIERKEQDGWEVDQLLPMLVALHELIPWLKQWHNDVDPEYGERLGDFYEGYLMEELRFWNLTQSDLLKWRPSADSGSRPSRQSRATVNAND